MSCDISKCNAKCCAAMLPISTEEKNKIVDYIKENDIKPVNWNKNQNIFNQQFSDICPFLGEDKKCLIYPVRAEICREFSCDHRLKNFNHKDKKIVNFYTEFFPELGVKYAPDINVMNSIYEEKKRGVGL